MSADIAVMLCIIAVFAFIEWLGTIPIWILWLASLASVILFLRALRRMNQRYDRKEPP